jgi:Tetracyclin repressor-like, C-terminal domain
VILRVLQRGVDEGLIRPDADLRMVLEMLTSPVIAAVLTHKVELTHAQVEFTVDTVLRGIAPLAG